MDYTDRIKKLNSRIRDREETLGGIESPYERQEVEESISQLKEERDKMAEKQNDAVKSPKHYTEGRKYEPKDVIRDWELNFNVGSAVKYLSRAGRKDDVVQDLKKAQEFIQFEIDAIEADRSKKEPPKDHPNCKCTPPYRKGSHISFEEALKHSEQMEKERDIKIDRIPLQHHEGEMLRVAVPVGMDPETVIKKVIMQIYGGK